MEEHVEFVEAVAKLTNCRKSSRKMRLVADLIRGKKVYNKKEKVKETNYMGVEQALGILKYTKNAGSRFIDKILLSAIANWSVLTGEEADEYDLVIKAIWVDQGTQLKRFRPAPHGRAHRIRKHSCHITLVVENTTALPVRNVEPEDAVELEETE